MNFKSKLILILFNLFFSEICCEDMTCVLVLHGRGESIPHGMAHNFAENLRSVIQNRNMTDYEVIEIGLSDDTEDDYNWSSFKSMSFQLEKLCQYIKLNVLTKLEQNFTRIELVGCSQGALLLRGLLKGQCLDSVAHKIDKLFTFGGPNNGIFGIPSCKYLGIDNSLVKFGCRMLERAVKTTGPHVLDGFIYSMERVLSFSSYWNSPENSSKTKTFLADINNENTSNPTKYLSEKLKALVVISFENDGIVLPPITSSFGYWDRNATNLIPFNETEFYKKDSFGLRTLDENKSLTFITIPNTTHMSIPLEFIESQFLTYI